MDIEALACPHPGGHVRPAHPRDSAQAARATTPATITASTTIQPMQAR